MELSEQVLSVLADELRPGTSKIVQMTCGDVAAKITLAFESDSSTIEVAVAKSSHIGSTVTITVLSNSPGLQTLSIACRKFLEQTRIPLGTRDFVKLLSAGELRIRFALMGPPRPDPRNRPPPQLGAVTVWEIPRSSLKSAQNVTLVSPDWTADGHAYRLELRPRSHGWDLVLVFRCANPESIAGTVSASATALDTECGDVALTPAPVTGASVRFPISTPRGDFQPWLDSRNGLQFRLTVDFSSVPAEEDRCAPGYVGLNNQGATCYMNAMLQSLFHLPAFRAFVYQMPTTGTEDPKTSIPLNLQRLFCRMQLGTKPCSTRPLTRSFGWGDQQGIVQHDTQEFCRVLMDNLETKMKNTPLQGRIAELFRGRFRSYIRGVHVDFQSGAEEEFYDLSLQVSGCKTLMDSFKRYTEQQCLDGENQYDAGDYGMQDAVMGVEFLEFPPVLQLHLRRFEYDPDYDTNTKVNDRFEFPPEIDLDIFLAVTADRSHSTQYDLYGVLVHVGEVDFGHYYAYLRTSTEPQWFEFNDANVTRARPEEAIQANFGGATTPPRHTKSYWEDNASAYFLVYVRHDAAAALFEPVPADAIPRHIREFMEQPDADARGHSTYYWKGKTTADVYDIDACACANCALGKVGFKCERLLRQFEVPEKETRQGMYEKIAALFGLSPDEIRVWYSNTMFPAWFYSRNDPGPLHYPTYYVYFAERKTADEPLDLGVEIRSIYLKFFHQPWVAPLQYLGIYRLNANTRALTLFPIVCHCLGIPEGTRLEMYRELQSDSVQKVSLMTSSTLRSSDINTGAVLVFTLAPGEPTPAFAFVPAVPEPEPTVPEPEPTAERDTQDSEKGAGPLPAFDLAAIAQSRDSLGAFYGRFQKSVARFIIARHSEPARPLCEILYRPSIAPADLLDLLRKVIEERILGRPIDPLTESFTVFRKDYYSAGPSTTPINIHHYASSAQLFTSGDDHQQLFFEVLEGIPAAELAAGTLFTPEIRMGSTLRKVNLVLPANARVADLIARLRAVGAVDADAPIRVIVSSTVIVSVLTPDSPLAAYHVPYVEVVPEDQRELPLGSRLLIAVLGEVTSSDYFSPVGWPSILPAAAGEKIGDLRPRVIAALGISAADATNTKFFTGEKYVPFLPANALKDDDDVAAVKDVIFALAGGKRKKPTRQREEGIRIDN
jgi:ubiquitin C-terminal hydrolase